MSSKMSKNVAKDSGEDLPPTTMCVKKRNGSSEPVDLNKVVRAIGRNCVGLTDVDPMRVATRTISGIYDGATTRELDELSIQTAADLIAEEPQYSRLAGRLLATLIEKEVRNQEIQAFSQSVATGHKLGLVNDRLMAFVKANARKLNDAIRPDQDQEFEYFGIRTVYDRYLLRHPTNRLVIETPQQFFLRIGCALAMNVKEALEMYRMFSSLEYLPSSPTLFNSGTTFEQLSSCFLIDSPLDDLSAIYDSYKEVALLSKFSGGIGLAYHRVRNRGSLIRGTNGLSNGIVPWLKTLDSSVRAVNQCFAPDTRVFTAQGAVPIRDVKEGNVVLGISGQYREVTKKMTYNQTDPMVSVKVKHSVSPVHVTAGHPFYVIQGIPMGGTESRAMSQLQRGKVQARWVDAGNLQKGDYVAQTIPTEVLPVGGLTEDDARLYGILLGDGHQSQDGDEWGVSGNPETDVHLTFVRDYLTSRGIHFWDQERGETYAQVRWATGMGAVRCGTTGRIVGRGAPTLPFSREDIYDPQGRKHISRRFRHLPKPQALAMVQGLIETDGCVSRGQEIQFTNTSEALVEDVRYQMLRLGVPTAGQFRTRDQDHTGTRSDGSTIQFKGETKAYDLRIPSVPELAEKVGCRPLTKKNWLTWQGQVFTRVKKVTPIAPVPFVIDLLVEGDESYMTTAGLAHNGGKRKGAACVYLEPWHADIEEFLELRDNTGDEAARTHNINLANWIPDLFMQRVEADGDWSLFDPKVVPELPDLYGPAFTLRYETAEKEGLAVRTVKARDLYLKMLKTLAQTGNGWMTFKDKSNLACNQTVLPGRTVHLSNLCVAPETRVLTRQGNEEIASLCDQEVEVWNGREWSRVTVKQTGKDVELIKVRLSNGVEIDCTPQHMFAVAVGPKGWDMVAAEDLREGQRLAKFEMPMAEADGSFSREHYAHGFFCGDGTYEASGRLRTTLYGVKQNLTEVLDMENNVTKDNSGRVHVRYAAGGLPPKFTVPHQGAVGEKISWLAGLLDSDGSLALNEDNESLQIGSVNLEFLREARLMLTTLGVDAKVTMMREAGSTMLPDGRGGMAEYPQQRMYRLLITSMDTHRLYTMGLRPRRVILSGYKPQRDARQFTRVVSVAWEGRVSDTYCFTEPRLHLGTFNGVVTGQCTEILEITNEEETAVCNLGSVNLGRHLKADGSFDFDKLAKTVKVAVRQLDRVIDLNFYAVPKTMTSNMKWRPVGLGVMGLQDVFFLQKVAFDSPAARELSQKVSEEIYYHALSTSCDLAEEKGAHPEFPNTRAARGELQFDAWNVVPTDTTRWEALRARVKKVGLRNSLIIAIAPTATIASIAGCYECIEPQVSNMFKRETLSGDFLQINRYLVNELKALGLWTDSVRTRVKLAEGSVQGITEIPEALRTRFRTVWEIPMRSLIDMAAERGAFIDQSQSLNLFMESPSIPQLSSMYMYAWKKGLKTTYYLRSRPATKIAKATIEEPAAPKQQYTEEEGLVCSLENPSACDACQ